MNIQFIDGAGYVARREFGEGIINCLKEGFDGIKFSLDSDDIVQSEITNKGIKGWGLASGFSSISPTRYRVMGIRVEH
jgi:hypothetical protein